MKVKKIDTTKHRNSNHIAFVYEVRDKVEAADREALKIPQSLIDTFNVTVQQEDDSFKIVAKSEYSEVLAELDNKRDKSYTGFYASTKAYLKHIDVDKQRAAKRILIECDSFGKNLTKKDYTAQSADTINLMQVLRDRLYPDVELLNLVEWLDTVESDNNNFLATYNDRQAEQAEKNALARLKVCRNNTDEAYKNLVAFINVGGAIYGEALYNELINAINVSIDYYENLIATRKGRADAKKDAAEAEETAPEID